MNLLINALMIVSIFAFSSGLVHHIQMEYKNGKCSGGGRKDAPYKLWEFKNDNKVCGGIMCHNEKGDALIYYCQTIPPFLDCARDNEYKIVDTTVNFPECCWKCVRPGFCDSKKLKQSGKFLALGGGNSNDKAKETGHNSNLDNKSYKESAANPNDKVNKNSEETSDAEEKKRSPAKRNC